MNKYKDPSDLDPIFKNERFMQSNALKKKIFRLKIREEKCESCNHETWCGHPIPLELHHKDGNPANNSLENLSILCANCHHLTETFCNSHKKTREKRNFNGVADIIKECSTFKELCLKLDLNTRGLSYMALRQYIKDNNLLLKTEESKEKSVKNGDSQIAQKRPIIHEKDGTIKVYYTPSPFKSKWNPTNQELLEAVWKEAPTNISKRLGVSPNSIKHRCKRRNIPVPPPGYWQKLQHGKVEECQKIKEELFKKHGIIV